MKAFHLFHRLTFVILLSLFFSHAIGQAFYSTTGMALGKLRAKQAIIPGPEEFVIEEYMNYHTHLLPMPKAEESVHMDLQWGYPDLEDPVLMIGLTTPLLPDMKYAAPLNLSLVIDRSGSMSGDRIYHAKRALRKLSQALRPFDVVSLIAFDHESIVLFPSQKVGNKETLLDAISRLEVRGSTDLNLGIMTGYKELLTYYDERKTNRLLILTDAVTNTGIVDPNQIIGNSKEFEHSYEIDCSMICLGNNFKYDLARDFTKSGRNSFHFIDDEEDLQKVFVDEVQGLLAPVAKDLVLDIQIDPQLEIEAFYGYEPDIEGNHISLPLNRMNHGLTQVILIKFHQKSGYMFSTPKVEASLRFFDIKQGRNQTLIQSKKLKRPFDSKPEPGFSELRKTYVIASMAQSLKDMSVHHHKGFPNVARAKVQHSLDQYHHMLRLGWVQEDEDIRRVASILESYAKAKEHGIYKEHVIADY